MIFTKVKESQDAIKQLPRKSKKFILGGFNGEVDTKGTDSDPGNCEKYGLEFINDEGEILLNFCALTHLAVAD